MNRKGMEIAMNTVVIVIIAIVTLGIIIGFITGILPGLIDNIPTVPDIMIHPTAENPVAFGLQDIKKGQSIPITIEVYNNLENEIPDTEKIIVTCDSLTGLTVSSIGQVVPVSEFRSFKVGLMVPKETTTKQYICMANLAGITDQFTIQVK